MVTGQATAGDGTQARAREASPTASSPSSSCLSVSGLFMASVLPSRVSSRSCRFFFISLRLAFCEAQAPRPNRTPKRVACPKRIAAGNEGVAAACDPRLALHVGRVETVGRVALDLHHPSPSARAGDSPGVLAGLLPAIGPGRPLSGRQRRRR